MQKKQFAVIDIGSAKITALIGERGVNGTFVIKARKEFVYDGYSEARFFDASGVKQILFSAAEFLSAGSRTPFSTVYVGVPGAFTEVFVKESQISFPAKKKIDISDVNRLLDAAFVKRSVNSVLINHSAIVYELNDYRRFADPVGAESEILKGKLSFITCDNYFMETVKNTLVALGFNTVECVSVALSEALYLLEPETRDRVAMLADVGHIATTFSLIQGDGILFQKNFDYGGGYISAEISRRLDTDFDTAEQLKRKVNFSAAGDGAREIIRLQDGQCFDAEEVRQAIRESIDGFCGDISEAMEDSGYAIPDYVPLTVTGGGISYLRGAKERISDRLGCAVEIVAPKVPLMDEPTESSILSVLELAISNEGE